MPSVSPDHLDRESITLDFRAPPPSPVGSARRLSSVANDEVLTEFLDRTLRVPDLVLPFPRQKHVEVPALDFQDVSVLGARDSLAVIGCFQVVNHGISQELIQQATGGAGAVFRAPPEVKRRVGVREVEMSEEVNGDHEEEEEFVWERSCGLQLRMEGAGYSNFREKMEALALAIEKVAEKIMLILQGALQRNISSDRRQKFNGCICHVYKHPHGVPFDRCITALRYDMIRKMIRGSDESHALSLHICDGASEFHVYSKKGWVSFTPLENALVVTAGDQLQLTSDGRYKHMIGRPTYASQDEDCISMAFLYSPPPSTKMGFHQEKKDRVISLREQAFFAVFFTIACQFMLHIYHKFCHL